MRRPQAPSPASNPLTLAAGTWLAAGIVLFGLTPLPLRDAQWGWTPAFWLLLAPALILGVGRWFADSHPAVPGERGSTARRRSGAAAMFPTAGERVGYRRRPTQRVRRAS